MNAAMIPILTVVASPRLLSSDFSPYPNPAAPMIEVAMTT